MTLSVCTGDESLGLQEEAEVQHLILVVAQEVCTPGEVAAQLLLAVGVDANCIMARHGLHDSLRPSISGCQWRQVLKQTLLMATCVPLHVPGACRVLGQAAVVSSWAPEHVCSSAASTCSQDFQLNCRGMRLISIVIVAAHALRRHALASS